MGTVSATSLPLARLGEAGLKGGRKGIYSVLSGEGMCARAVERRAPAPVARLGGSTCAKQYLSDDSYSRGRLRGWRWHSACAHGVERVYGYAWALCLGYVVDVVD